MISGTGCVFKGFSPAAGIIIKGNFLAAGVITEGKYSTKGGISLKPRFNLNTARCGSFISDFQKNQCWKWANE